jgi:tight adherence protein B
MDVNLMVTAVIIQREVGGSLSEILESISAVIRDRMRLKREVRVLTTQGRATGVILGCLPITLGAVLHFVGKMTYPNEPSFIEPMFHVTAGQWMLAGAAVLQVIGFVVIWRIVSIKV